MISHLSKQNVDCITAASCEWKNDKKEEMECTGCPIFKIREILEMAYLESEGSLITEYKLFYMEITKVNDISVSESDDGAELPTVTKLNESVVVGVNGNINITVTAKLDVDDDYLVLVESFTEDELGGNEPLRSNAYVI